MSISPPRLYVRDYGVFYIRTITPKALQASTGKRETWHSLRTKDRAQAKVLALSYALELAKAQAGMTPKPKTLADTIANPLRIATPAGFTVDYDPANPAEKAEAQAFIQAHTPAVTDQQRRAWQAQDLQKMRDSEEAFRLAEAERDAIIEQARKPKGRRFAPLVEEYFKLHSAGIAPRTAKKYRSAIQTFLDWCWHDATLDRITPEVWHEFKIFLATSDPATGRAAISAKTIDTYTNAVANVLRMAQGKTHALTGQTLVKRKQRQNPVLRAFTPDELKRIFDPERLNACRHPSDVWGNFLALFTGARLNEIFQLRLADVRVV